MRWANLKEEDLARLEDGKPVCFTASPNAKDCEEMRRTAKKKSNPHVCKTLKVLPCDLKMLEKSAARLPGMDRVCLIPQYSYRYYIHSVASSKGIRLSACKHHKERRGIHMVRVDFSGNLN